MNDNGVFPGHEAVVFTYWWAWVCLRRRCDWLAAYHVVVALSGVIIRCQGVCRMCTVNVYAGCKASEKIYVVVN